MSRKQMAAPYRIRCEWENGTVKVFRAADEWRANHEAQRLRRDAVPQPVSVTVVNLTDQQVSGGDPS